MENEVTGELAQDSKNLALLTWVGTIFFGFIPCLIIYLMKKDDQFLQDHAKEALNWSITAIIGYVVGMILTFVLIGIFVIFAVGICHLIFCIMGAVAASHGKSYRAPFTIRPIK